jgi:hypothetical protein
LAQFLVFSNLRLFRSFLQVEVVRSRCIRWAVFETQTWIWSASYGIQQALDTLYAWGEELIRFDQQNKQLNEMKCATKRGTSKKTGKKGSRHPI